MKESRAYLKFFKENLLLLIIPGLLGAFIGFYYLYSQPVKFVYQALLEFKLENKDYNQVIPQVDQAVTLLRSQNIQKMLEIPQGVRVFAFRPGPLLLKLELKSQRQENLGVNRRIFEFLDARYNYTLIGDTYISEEGKPYLLYVLISLGGGVLIGLLIALARSYFQKY